MAFLLSGCSSPKEKVVPRRSNVTFPLCGVPFNGDRGDKTRGLSSLFLEGVLDKIVGDDKEDKSMEAKSSPAGSSMAHSRSFIKKVADTVAHVVTVNKTRAANRLLLGPVAAIMVLASEGVSRSTFCARNFQALERPARENRCSLFISHVTRLARESVATIPVRRQETAHSQCQRKKPRAHGK